MHSLREGVTEQEWFRVGPISCASSPTSASPRIRLPGRPAKGKQDETTTGDAFGARYSPAPAAGRPEVATVSCGFRAALAPRLRAWRRHVLTLCDDGVGRLVERHSVRFQLVG